MLTGPYLTAFEMRGGKSQFSNLKKKKKFQWHKNPDPAAAEISGVLFILLFLMDFIRNEDVLLCCLGLSQNIDVWQ